MTATAYRLDVTDLDEILAVRDRIADELGAVDILVNNAGTVAGGAFLEVPLEQHLRTIRVNTEGVIAVTHAFLPGLIERPKAAVVTVASVAGWGPAPFGTSYGASKWAAIGFTESLRVEMAQLGHDHVGVTTICPSVVDTGLFEGVPPLRLTTLLTAEDVAKATVDGVSKRKAIVLIPWLSKFAPGAAGAAHPDLRPGGGAVRRRHDDVDVDRPRRPRGRPLRTGQVGPARGLPDQ